MKYSFFKATFRKWHVCSDARRFGVGPAVLVGVFLLLAFLAGLHYRVVLPVLQVGDVAEEDIVAFRSGRVADPEATESRRQRIAAQQPLVFDLSSAPVADLHQKVMETLTRLDELEFSEGGLHGMPAMDHPGSFFYSGSASWEKASVRQYAVDVALPWFETKLRRGVLTDMRAAIGARNGIVIRNLDDNTEQTVFNFETLEDIDTLRAMFFRTLRMESKLTREDKLALYAFFGELVKPTLTVNSEVTEMRRQFAASAVAPVEYSIRQGDVIVFQGETVTREKHLKLKMLSRENRDPLQLRIVAGSFMMLLLIGAGLYISPGNLNISSFNRLKDKDFIFLSVVLFVCGFGVKNLYLVLSRAIEPQALFYVGYLFPTAGFAGLCAMILSAKRYCAVSLMLAFIHIMMFREGIVLFLFSFMSCMLSTRLSLTARSRQDIVLNFFPMVIGMAAVGIACGWLVGFRGCTPFLYMLGTVFANGLLSVTVIFALSPIMEMSFGYTTRFRLMELMNFEQPLLREMMVRIPGTYQHSLVVANMVEAGAGAIGANILLCRVAALYHDIGKLAYPGYYIENQFGGPNRHDHLAPSMSALILLSHVKKGVEMAKAYRLGDEITEIIAQHHGTSLMRYFFGKAQNAGENPRKEDYSYPGPKPQSREAAIVMLADVVEASSRTLNDPTPERLRSHVEIMIKNLFADGQLDESRLTFRDLHIISETFVRTLSSLHHQRIAYPNVKTDRQQTLPQTENDGDRHEYTN
ncbi:MAG: HDIG domain-containing protein [Desulfovibrionaceae bacterium]|nr:HDIG domain-containing protein [Desulfovibrionaceae bacterium]